MKILGLGIIAFLLFVLQRRIYEKFWSKNLKVSVAFSQKSLTEGEQGEVIEVIENRKWLPLAMLKVKFQTSRNLEFDQIPGSTATDQYYRNDIFQIGGGEKITRKLSFIAKKRGYYHIKNIDLVGADLFLTNEKGKSMSTNCYLYVYPKMFNSREFLMSLQRLNGEVIVKRHMLEDPFEYRGIREYQPYDDIRSVNWKATAKTGDLMVNQRNYTAMQTIRIFLNTEDSGVLKRHDEMEACMQIVMGLAGFFLGQGIKVAFYSNGKDIITGEPMTLDGGAGAGQQDAIGRALARIDVAKEPWNFVELFEEAVLNDAGSTITLFVSPNGYDDFLELLGRYEEKGMTYTWFYPYDSVEKPLLPEAFQKNVQFLKFRKQFM